ncbi:MAG: alpha/beta hydrolase [Nanoarchaeota archaeon]|nr:alpha/beta hydrolase [Nanoarchaeota archaeon]
MTQNNTKMKKVIILHGTGSTPQSYWHPYIKEKLEEKEDFQVIIPGLPNTNNPDINITLPYILENYEFDERTILIGHSSGCPLILSILEHINCTIQKTILVAGFIDSLNSPALQKSYNFDKIKSNCRKFIFINSDNDPWGCDDVQGRKMLNALDGDLIIRKGEGHMGSQKFNQEYKEFPLLLKLI